MASNADGASLTEIGGTGEVMAAITLRVGQPARHFRVVPNKGDVSIEDAVRSIGGGVTGDGFVGLAQFAGEPGNPLAVTLTPLAPTAPGTPSHLVGQFDSATEPGETQIVPFDYDIEVLPENADGTSLEEIV